jgi:hypothetical protein
MNLQLLTTEMFISSCPVTTIPVRFALATSQLLPIPILDNTLTLQHDFPSLSQTL